LVGDDVWEYQSSEYQEAPSYPKLTLTIYFGLNDQEQLVSAAGIGAGNSVAKDIRLAEMLIAAQKTMNPAELSDPNLNLKKLLKS